MKKKILHRNSRDFRDFVKKGESTITPILKFGVIKHKDNMRHCNDEVKKRALNGNLLLLLFQNFPFCYLKLQRLCLEIHTNLKE